MADDLKNIGTQDQLRINVNEEHELAYWTKALGVSKRTVAPVGAQPWRHGR